MPYIPPKGRPAGKLHISRLFLLGVYKRVLRWRVEAERALRKIRAGEVAVPPATLVDLVSSSW